MLFHSYTVITESDCCNHFERKTCNLTVFHHYCLVFFLILFLKEIFSSLKLLHLHLYRTMMFKLIPSSILLNFLFITCYLLWLISLFVYLLQHPNRSKGKDTERKNGLTFKRVCLDILLLSEEPERERGNLLD